MKNAPITASAMTLVLAFCLASCVANPTPHPAGIDGSPTTHTDTGYEPMDKQDTTTTATDTSQGPGRSECEAGGGMWSHTDGCTVPEPTEDVSELEVTGDVMVEDVGPDVLFGEIPSADVEPSDDGHEVVDANEGDLPDAVD